MMNKMMLTGVALGALLLSGCGGSKSKSITEQIKERDGILVIYNYPDDVCKSQLLKDTLTSDGGAQNIITSVESGNVSCQTYGRSNNGITCEENTFGGYPNTCVIGLDAPTNSIIDTDIIMATVPDMLIETY